MSDLNDYDKDAYMRSLGFQWDETFKSWKLTGSIYFSEQEVKEMTPYVLTNLVSRVAKTFLSLQFEPGHSFLRHKAVVTKRPRSERTLKAVEDDSADTK